MQEYLDRYLKLLVNAIYYHCFHNAGDIFIRKIILHPSRYQPSQFSETYISILGAHYISDPITSISTALPGAIQSQQSHKVSSGTITSATLPMRKLKPTDANNRGIGSAHTEGMTVLGQQLLRKTEKVSNPFPLCSVFITPQLASQREP